MEENGLVFQQVSATQFARLNSIITEQGADSQAGTTALCELLALGVASPQRTAEQWDALGPSVVMKAGERVIKYLFPDDPEPGQQKKT